MNNNELRSHLLLKACDCCVFNVIVLVRFYCASVFKIAKGTYSCMCVRFMQLSIENWHHYFFSFGGNCLIILLILSHVI